MPFILQGLEFVKKASKIGFSTFVRNICIWMNRNDYLFSGVNFNQQCNYEKQKPRNLKALGVWDYGTKHTPQFVSVR